MSRIQTIVSYHVVGITRVNYGQKFVQFEIGGVSLQRPYVLIVLARVLSIPVFAFVVIANSFEESTSAWQLLLSADHLPFLRDLTIDS